MEEIGKMCRENKVFFHTDGAQAVGKVPVDVNASNIDLMSISAHKIYGPKGIGAIYVRRRPRVRLEAKMSGGGQVLPMSHLRCPCNSQLPGMQQSASGILGCGANCGATCPICVLGGLHGARPA